MRNWDCSRPRSSSSTCSRLRCSAGSATAATAPRLLAAGVALWSLATAAGAFAGSYAALFAARAAVGVGEAAYATIAPAMLADLYPREKRGRAFAVFFLATPVGSALGYILGGLIDQRYGWRAAFLVAGAPGLLLALAFLALRDPPRGGAEPEESGALRSPGPQEARVAGFFGPWRRLLRNGLYVRTVAGYAAYTFALGALAFWTPAFLERVRGVPRAEATVVFGAIAVATGIVGTLAGGWLTDKLKPEGATARALALGLGDARGRALRRRRLPPSGAECLSDRDRRRGAAPLLFDGSDQRRHRRCGFSGRAGDRVGARDLRDPCLRGRALAAARRARFRLARAAAGVSRVAAARIPGRRLDLARRVEAAFPG
jgi:hypothetical protein